MTKTERFLLACEPIIRSEWRRVCRQTNKRHQWDDARQEAWIALLALPGRGTVLDDSGQVANGAMVRQCVRWRLLQKLVSRENTVSRYAERYTISGDRKVHRDSDDTVLDTIAAPELWRSVEIAIDLKRIFAEDPPTWMDMRGTSKQAVQQRRARWLRRVGGDPAAWNKPPIKRAKSGKKFLIIANWQLVRDMRARGMRPLDAASALRRRGIIVSNRAVEDAYRKMDHEDDPRQSV